ncbi:HAD family hydrolase [Streptomyces sp. NBC_00503]|uniref:HAD family hydrolase n=1 Tax=Streptomyces sp. NBC_00503 TaxID=2903659 RepID=UPI002E80D23A|nr:HAD family hydrolase [Streptomyces sp. NBC_00503]WUD86386.1 HAD-IB family hydrolase [Streptomyces sp. NBC_00503]
MSGVPTRLVFSDVDETLINCKSMFDFLDYYLTGRYGDRGAATARSVRETLLAQAASGVPRERTNRTYFRAWAGESAAEVRRWGQRWFAERSAEPSFYLAATREALRGHRAQGAAVVLVSGSFPALLDPIAADVGAAHVVCTVPQSRGGVLTGEIVGEPVIGEGKSVAVRELFGRYPQLDPAECFGYGDHISDLPMLAAVGHPVVVGGSAALLARLPAARRLAAAA